MDDLEELARDVASAVRSRKLQQGKGTQIEHSPPAARYQTGQTSVASQRAEKLSPVDRQDRTPASGGSGGMLKRTSERLRNMRLDFEQASSSVDYGTEAPESRDQSQQASSIPSTNSRKNVTKRRSNGRARDSLGSTSVPVDELVARVPKIRPQDAAYALEMEGARQTQPPQSPIMKSHELGSVASYMNHDDDQADHPGPDFTRRQIPSEVDSPSLHKTLKRMWIRKKGLEEDMTEAKEKGKGEQYGLFAEQHAALNREMFEAVHQANMSGEEDRGSKPPRLPEQALDYGFDHNQSSQRRQPNNKEPTSKSWEYEGASSFMIWFTYRDEEFPYIVWLEMPVALLVEAAAGILMQNGETWSGEEITKDQIVLMHADRFMDATFERLSDHDVEPEDLVEILVTRKQIVPKATPDAKTSWSDKRSDNASLYYAVRKGRVPGIYRSWNDCKSQVDGYPQCEFKSFVLEHEAIDYVSLRQDQHHVDDTPRRAEQANYDPEKFGARPQDKIKQSFKCPRFSGNTKDWKIWNKGFQRYLSIWDLEYVLLPNFFEDMPLSSDKVRDNKLVYFLLEDATQASPLAASYHRQAPLHNGFEAYYTLHDGFVFAAATASTILLNELSNFRFQPDETPTALIMRLEELIQDMEMLPDGAAMTFTDTQRIGYLLGALRHESEWATVTSTITSSQLKGDLTFRQACAELRVRCEADRAYDIIDKGVKPKRRVPGLVASVEPILNDTAIESMTTALISSMAKRLNKEDDGKAKRRIPCLAKGCTTTSPFSLCGLHYHSIISGKTPELELDKDYGHAKYNVTTKQIEYPAKVPKDRLPPTRTKAQ